jgi:hypothetical protein
LREGLRHRNPQVRSLSAFALSSLGSAAVPAVPDLAGLLKDDDAEVRYGTAFTLSMIGYQTREATPALVAALPALTAALEDSSPTVRSWAKVALVMINARTVETFARSMVPSTLVSVACPSGPSGLSAACTAVGWQQIGTELLQNIQLPRDQGAPG